jgi:UDP-glucose 4-epimerase
MKVVIFGGSGFLGSHVADELTKRNYQVTIFDFFESKFLCRNQKMIIGDILDKDLVRKIVKENDIVYHFAAIADIKKAKISPIETVNFNIIGTINILEACREFNIIRFLYASTIYVYSDQGSFYRSSKQACELFIENYKQEYNLDYTILRYGSLYGDRANDFNFIRNAIIQALTEKVIVRKGNGEELRDYINISDAAILSVDALDDNYKNNYVMITGDEKITIKDLLSTIREIMNNNVEIKYLEDETMEGHYNLTPYSFKPNIAKKIKSKSYLDLGQGLLDLIYNINQEITDEKNRK